ncbi:hypothetical protein DPMN_044008 [Dreissena polymorpha]|uniref:DOP1-like middle TPR domain-containing protein n=1 Tax=Dreissena polymorpha TaxID=45954 RepID=A0A9D4D2G3_DREPO|nr:hypothetical protein DPMN_044008 [Dreissena polymorpha]
MTYFERYSRDLLVQALRQLLVEKPGGSDTVSARSAVLKPFRILISLLDKPEIGPVILESVLLSIFRCLCREYDISKSSKVSAFVKQALKKDDSYYEELLKTANLLFGTFEPYFIWDYASRKFQEACAGSHEGFVGNQEACIGSQDGCAGSQRSLRKISGSQSMSEPQESADIDELCTLVAYLLDIVSLVTHFSSSR